jgi:hypothetical protein
MIESNGLASGLDSHAVCRYVCMMHAVMSDFQYSRRTRLKYESYLKHSADEKADAYASAVTENRVLSCGAVAAAENPTATNNRTLVCSFAAHCAARERAGRPADSLARTPSPGQRPPLPPAVWSSEQLATGRGRHSWEATLMCPCPCQVKMMAMCRATSAPHGPG